MKKLSAFLLILAMLVTMVPLFSVTAIAAEENTGTSDTAALHIAIAAEESTKEVDGVEYTVLRTSADFEKIKKDSEGGTGGHFILANDIDFSDESGDATNVEAYPVDTLTLDGNGYTVKGFCLTGTGSLSFFSLSGTAETVIRNISFGSQNEKIQVSCKNTAAQTGNVGVGVLVSYTATPFRFENVNVYAVIEAAQRIHTGGFVGRVHGGKVTMTGCNFYGSVTGTSTAAGDVGYAGLIGKITAKNVVLRMTNCCNYGNITASGAGTNHKTAGMIAASYALDSRIENCINYGNVTTGGVTAGGFSAELTFNNGKDADMDASLKYSFRNCINYGKITGTNQVGGFAGLFKNTDGSDTTAVGGLLELDSCRNYGDIVASGNDTKATKKNIPASGGLIGIVYLTANVIAEKCANFGTLNGGGIHKGGLFGYATLTAYTENGAEQTPVFTVNDSLNAGLVESSARGAGIVASVTAVPTYELNRCINIGNIRSTTNGGVGGILGVAVNGTKNVTLTGCLGAGEFFSNSTNMGCLTGGNNTSVKDGGANYAYNASGSAGVKTALDSSASVAVLENWNAVNATLNSTYSTVWGPFILNSDENGVVLATPKLAGIQMGKAENGRFSVRLVATLDSLQYQYIGFNIEPTENVGRKWCEHVYTKLTATDAGGSQIEVSAAELGGKYVYAIAVANIPASGNVVLTVTPFAVDKNAVDEENNPVEYLGDAFTLTFVDGVFQGATPVKAN